MHHAKHHTDPMIVHLNERYIENDDLDFFDDISVCGILDAPDVEIKWAKPTHSLNKINHFVSSQNIDSKSQPLLQIQNNPERNISSTSDLCSRLFNMCFCRNRKD